jgi:two-component system sensor histidine kinase DegS
MLPKRGVSVVDLPVADQLQHCCETYRQEQDGNRRQIDEIDRLLRQTQTDAEKLAQREMSASSQLRHVQGNLERFSKEEIRNMFALVQEIQVRLLSVRAQVEQLQTKRQRLAERQAELQSLLPLMERIAESLDRPTSLTAHAAAQPNNSLISEVMEAQEKERQRISLQMHDGPAQMLSNLVLRAEICERLLGRDLEQARNELGVLKKSINATLQDTRRFIFDLRPMILDDLGLIPTLRRYAQDFGDKFGLNVAITAQNIDNRLPRQYEVALFRFIQEALANVATHANAATARVTLELSDDQLRVVIEDDGMGFNPDERLKDRPGRRAIGVAIMRQQIETLLRGQLSIDSAAGQGTRTVATMTVPTV